MFQKEEKSARTMEGWKKEKRDSNRMPKWWRMREEWDVIKESGDESVLRERCARNREWKKEWKEEVSKTEEKDVKYENDVSNKQG